MYIAALFTIDKMWKQPKFHQKNEWIKNMACIYTNIYICICKMEYYPAIKKKKILSRSKKNNNPAASRTKTTFTERETR